MQTSAAARTALQRQLHEGGSNLSGGQRQRLAMARALLHDQPIYVFDEATSNVDVESENDIMKAIHSLAGRKTVILISHRLANVVDSDYIYVLEAGASPSRERTTTCWRHRAGVQPPVQRPETAGKLRGVQCMNNTKHRSPFVIAALDGAGPAAGPDHAMQPF